MLKSMKKEIQQRSQMSALLGCRLNIECLLLMIDIRLLTAIRHGDIGEAPFLLEASS